MSYIINLNAEKVYNLCFTYRFLRHIHEEYLSLKDAHDEQNRFASKFKNIDKGIKSI